MSPRSRTSAGSVRRFLLASPPEGARGAVALAAGEADHARRVLRLVAGDRLIGLDGAGAAWPLRVVRADPRAFDVAIDGEPEREPAPGEAGAPLAWIEIVTALPRGERAEQMVDRLVQLGAAAVVPVTAERAPPNAAHDSPRRAERLVRVAREACKQAGRLWWPRIDAPRDLAEQLARAGAERVVLDPEAGAALPQVLGALAAGRAPATWTRERPLELWVGPEGGFAPAEQEALARAGARGARLGPHILRIETAAEAALAVATALLPAP